MSWVRLVICSCSSLAWWRERERKHKRRGGEVKIEGRTRSERDSSLFHLLSSPADGNTCATLSHNAAYDRVSARNPLTPLPPSRVRQLDLNFLSSSFFCLLASFFRSRSLIQLHFFYPAAVWRGFSDRDVMSHIYIWERKKKHFQCSCHVVGAFLYFFFLVFFFYKTLESYRKEKVTVFSSTHTHLYRLNAGSRPLWPSRGRGGCSTGGSTHASFMASTGSEFS